MNFIKNIFIDSMNGMSLSHLPLFIFQILMAGFLAHLFQLFINKKSKTELIQNSALISIAFCVLVSLVKYSLPFSVIGLSVVMLFSNSQKDASFWQKISLLILGIIGIGCGVGSVVQTLVGVLFILLIVLITSRHN